MLGVIGKKVGMTRIFDERGHSIPCTVIYSEPSKVVQIKTISKDGYESVQLGCDNKKEKRVNKSEKGHFSKSKVAPKRKLVEFRDFQKDFEEEVKLGDSISVSDLFEIGEYVDVTGTSKGKGFQGVVKRHGFAGVGERTHGQHNRQRAPGSIGGASFPSRVFKGIRMAGRTGNDRVTIQNLEVLKILPESNLVVLRGAVPGGKNSYVIIKK